MSFDGTGVPTVISARVGEWEMKTLHGYDPGWRPVPLCVASLTVRFIPFEMIG
ncbi:hypothetical protein GCM10009794_04080 [Rothia terrae]